MTRQKKITRNTRRKRKLFLRKLLILLLILLGIVVILLGMLYFKGNNITAISKLLDFKRFGTVDIVIDPGHGDHDPGAIADTIYEKDITLAIALKAKDVLTDAGYKVVLTRIDDTFLELGERSGIANKKEAKVFVSIHCNSSEDGSGQGIETFYTDQKTEEDVLLAEKIQSNLIKQTNARDREIRTANYTVLVRTKMPAVLVEAGFLTNDSERSLLVDEEYQNQLASGIAIGIEEFLEETQE